jgi:hypothetical protein
MTLTQWATNFKKETIDVAKMDTGYYKTDAT